MSLWVDGLRANNDLVAHSISARKKTRIGHFDFNGLQILSSGSGIGRGIQCLREEVPQIGAGMSLRFASSEGPMNQMSFAHARKRLAFSRFRISMALTKEPYLALSVK